MNRPRAILTAILIATILAAGCGGGTDETEAAITAASRAFVEAYCQGDGDALAALYTEDAVLQPPGQVIRGRDGIREFLAPKPGHECMGLTIEPASLTVDGDVVVDRGTWSRTWREGEGEPQTETSHYLAVWVREDDGAWRMSQNMWHEPITQP
jgi:uncharacterized protein (TIGR02246 family)